jgi:hypothetical protein
LIFEDNWNVVVVVVGSLWSCEKDSGGRTSKDGTTSLGNVQPFVLASLDTLSWLMSQIECLDQRKGPSRQGQRP